MDRDIVLIEWLDSKGLERWEYLDEIEFMPPAICYSVGFMTEDHAEYKTGMHPVRTGLRNKL